MEAYVSGVSTRKVDELVLALGCESGISKSELNDGTCPEKPVHLTSAFACAAVLSVHSPGASLPVAVSDVIDSPESCCARLPLHGDLIDPGIKCKREVFCIGEIRLLLLLLLPFFTNDIGILADRSHLVGPFERKRFSWQHA